MEQFLAADVDIICQLSKLGVYDYIIVGSGIGGGILAEELAGKKKKVLLIEKGGPTFSTHVCNVPRPDFARGHHDSPEGNETIYNTIKSWVQTADDSEPYVGGPLHCLGGRSVVWGLWIPSTDSATLDNHFPKAVAKDLQDSEKGWFNKASDLMTNRFRRAESSAELEAKQTLSGTIFPIIAKGHQVAVGPIAAQFDAPSPYRFPQGAYSTVVPLLNRIYARDKYLTVLMHAEVVYFDVSKSFQENANDTTAKRRVTSLTVRISSSIQRTYQISAERAKVILCAGTIGTASIALNSGLQTYNPLVGKGLIDHAIWGVRFAKRLGRHQKSRDPIILQCLINICDSTALLTVTLNSDTFLAGSPPQLKHLPTQYLDSDTKETIPFLELEVPGQKLDTIAILLEFGAELNDKNEVLMGASSAPVIRVRRLKTYSDEKYQYEMQLLATLIRNRMMKSSDSPSLPELESLLSSLSRPLPPESFPKRTIASSSSLQLFPLPGPSIPFPTPSPLLAFLHCLELAPRLSLLGCGIFAHEVGTMRMGEPDKKRVVDENLQACGFKNLHVCDLSVFPYSPPSNPTLTLAALSLRLSEYLLEQEGGEE